VVKLKQGGALTVDHNVNTLQKTNRAHQL
jgi:hypothetical protein